MESLHGKLGRLAEEMTEAQRKEFKRRSEGGARSVESLLNIAEGVMKDETVRESRRIARNNGANRPAQESDPQAESDRILMEALADRDPRLKASLEASEGSALTAQEAQDAEFCRLIGMSEADAARVAKSKFIRG